MSDPRWRLGERFELLGQMGAGAAGTVWRGRDARTGAEHAVKVLRPDLVADPDAVTELYATLGAVARLGHPGIVAVDDAAVGEGWFALRSRLVLGEDLRSLLSRQGTVAPAVAAPLVAQLCDALAAAHAAGIAHGDVHPSNILLVSGVDGLPQAGLTDFGMAALINRAAARGAGNAAPPAEYRAPELAPAQAATAAADVYAAGILLYEILAGCPPFRAQSPGEIADMHRRDQPPPISGLPNSLWPAVAACLEKDPRYRPTAVLFATALRDDDAASRMAGVPIGGPSRPSPEALTTRIPPVAAPSNSAQSNFTPQDAGYTLLLPGLSAAAPESMSSHQYGDQQVDQHGDQDGGGRLPHLIRAHKTESGIALAVAVVAALIAAAVTVGGSGSANGAVAGPVVSTTVAASTSPTPQAVILPPGPSPSPTPSATTPTTFGEATLVSAQSGKCLDTAGRNFADGTTEDIYTCNATPAQSWTMTAAQQLTQDGGTYCLDDTNFGTAPGTKVVLWSCNGGANQQWTIHADGSITSNYAHLCLDVIGQATDDGTALDLSTCDGQPSQQWSLH